MLNWVLLAGLALMWGTSFAFTRVAVEDLSPTVLAALRIAIAALALNFVRARAGLRLPRDARAWVRLLPLGVTGSVLPFVLVGWGQQQLDSGLAGVLMAATPLAAVVLAHFTLPSESLTRRKTLGVLLALAGVVVLLGPESLLGLGDGDVLPRQLAVLGSALAYAANTVLARRLPPTHPLVYGSGVTLVGAVLAVALAALRGEALPLTVEAPALGATIMLGLFPTGLATLVHYQLVRRAGASFASLTNYIVPVVALMLGALWFGEPIEPAALAGLALILAGVAAAAKRADAPEESSRAAVAQPGWLRSPA